MRGGKRKGAGRPSIGKTKRVSITLPGYVWDYIEENHTYKAQFFRQIAMDKVRQSNIDDYIKQGDDI